jgi:PAS domain-containing protein
MEENISHNQAVQSETAMKIILEASPVGIVVFDHEARVLYTNPLADSIFNKKPETAAKMKCGDFISCAHRETTLCPLPCKAGGSGYL